MLWFYRIFATPAQRVAGSELAGLARQRFGSAAEQQLERKLRDPSITKGRFEARLALAELRAWRALENKS